MGKRPPRFGVELNLLWMYLTLPVTSATSEGTFSTLRRLTNYLRSTIKQDRLKKLEQLPTDALSQIGYGYTRHCEDWKEIYLCQKRQGHFGGGMRMAEWKMSPPPIPIRFKTLRRLG